MDTISNICHRCEIRVYFLETGKCPKPECSCLETPQKECCAYLPVKPLIMKKKEGDERAQFAPSFIAAVSVGVRLPEDIRLEIIETTEGHLPFWTPEKQSIVVETPKIIKRKKRKKKKIVKKGRKKRKYTFKKKRKKKT